MTLTQNAAKITGDYTVTTAGDQQGTNGHITPTDLGLGSRGADGRTVAFNWTQDHKKKGAILPNTQLIEPNAFHGTGTFRLCADGNHFTGTYESAPHPLLTADLLKGTWIGTRKGAAAGVQDKIANAYKAWLSTNGVTNASLVVMQNGCIIGQYGFGNRRTTTVMSIASLTKAVTAMCVANLVDAGKLSYTDKVSTRLSSFFKSATIADKRANDITIEHLLRHTSGFSGAATAKALKKASEDPVVPPWAAGVTNTASADETFAKAMLAKNLTGAPGSVMSDYNNVNYALLGMIIKQVTGQSYEAYCRQTVLTSPRFHGFPVDQPRIGTGISAMGAFGGWEMTVEQYADFIDTH
jgi:CubicO group peptidase (beta-lactamase class C family)